MVHAKGRAMDPLTVPHEFLYMSEEIRPSIPVAEPTQAFQVREGAFANDAVAVVPQSRFSTPGTACGVLCVCTRQASLLDSLSLIVISSPSVSVSVLLVLLPAFHRRPRKCGWWFSLVFRFRLRRQKLRQQVHSVHLFTLYFSFLLFLNKRTKFVGR